MGANLLYDLYERRLARGLEKTRLPAHIAVMLDGNRRWAKSVGASPAQGHRKGADKITEFLTWSADARIERVTLWMLSTDNLGRDPEEVADLLDIIAATVEALADDGRWRICLVGDLDLLPGDYADRLRAAAERNAAAVKDGLNVNIAVGYGGRHEITDAVRALLLDREKDGFSLEEVAQTLTLDDIADHLYTAGQPDPDLVIRTSGEQRLSGFLLWQSVHSEFYFCETYWPDFRRVDFFRALRDYGQRERRLGR
ncbi:MAG TPA: isoprenyl transferase [Actinomycetaceae bacterium]|nr:isoprenyl transferase [Actinomycetaceae bacterium]